MYSKTSPAELIHKIFPRQIAEAFSTFFTREHFNSGVADFKATHKFSKRIFPANCYRTAFAQ